MIADLLKIIPKNIVSFVTGWMMRCRIPHPLFVLMARCFVRLFKIDLNECIQPLESFHTLEDIFIRNLKPGQRIVQGSFCSPADGILVRAAAIDAGSKVAVQCKGIEYNLEMLLLGVTATKSSVELASYLTIYLAPHNYHRVHSPCSGVVRVIRYIPGKLWPVNQWASTHLPGLFVQNERLVFEIDIDNGGRVYVVMVGALNVGRIQTRFWKGFVTNSIKRQVSPTQRIVETSLNAQVEAGDELGVFMLGSTVIVVLNKEAAIKHPILASEAKSTIIVGRSMLRDI